MKRVLYYYIFAEIISNGSVQLAISSVLDRILKSCFVYKINTKLWCVCERKKRIKSKTYVQLHYSIIVIYLQSTYTCSTLLLLAITCSILEKGFDFFPFIFIIFFFHVFSSISYLKIINISISSQ